MRARLLLTFALLAPLGLLAQSSNNGTLYGNASGSSASPLALTQIPAGFSAASPFQVGSSTASASQSFAVDSASGFSDSLSFQSAAQCRWQMFKDSTAESGSNAGANFGLRACSDTGATLDSVISITRAAGGALTFDRHLVFTNTTGTATAISGTGCTGSGTPNDARGIVTTSSATTCTVTFGTAFPAAPACTVSTSSTSTTAAVTSTAVGSAVFSFSSTLTGTLYYLCAG